jgi:uncharacterized protein YecE (DUF72 family)
VAVIVGTGGWSVPAWYPEDLATADRLAWLAERLDCVEVDSSFYALPARRTVEQWAKTTPDEFTFVVKLHRALSRHAAPLKSLPRDLRDDVEVTDRGRVALSDRLQDALLERTVETFEPLAVAAYLLQLTPAFRPGDHELDELDPIIQALAPVPVAVELRQTAWLGDREATLAWFREAGAVWVDVDAPDVDTPTAMPAVDEVTRSDLAFLRAHGRNAKGYVHGRSAAERFDHTYTESELGELAERVRSLASQADTVIAIMSNGDHALDAAEKLITVGS